jgi:hypothetical protein
MNSQVSIENPELLALKRQKARLLQKRVTLLTSLGGMARYHPHEKQDLFHRAGMKFRKRMVRSGNRFGKSTMGCAEDCAWLRGERIWYPKDSPERTMGIPKPPNKGVILTEDWDLVDSIFTTQRGGDQGDGKIWKMLPRDGFVRSTKRNHSGVIDTIECANGSLLRFDTVRSWKSNPGGGESADWDFIHVDEPCPQKMYKAYARGLMDRRGSVWFTLTPLSEFWISDMFFPEDTGGKMRDDVWAIDGTTYDNPYLTPEAIADYEKDLDEDERQCRIYGIPLHLSGLVYKEFGWDRHVLQDLPKGWKSYSQPPDEWPIYFAIDPHPRTPHAVLFCTVDPFGKRYYFEDIFRHCVIRDLCPDIHQVFKMSNGKPRNVIWGKCDPLAYIDDPIDDTNMALEFEKCGVFVEKATKARAAGILKVKAGLKERRILFTPGAKRTLWEIQRYAWDDEKDVPKDEDDHMMENLYRLELGEPRWVDFNAKSTPIEDIEIVRPELNLEDISFAV